MDDIQTVKQTIEEVVRGRDTLYLLGLVVVGLVSVIGAFAAAYLKKKGENYATHEDAEAIRGDLEKTITATEILKAEISRRSDFEKQILADQYGIVLNLERRMVQISSNLNRIRQGMEVKDFIVDGDIVPLTEVFEELETVRWMLNERLYRTMKEQATILIQIANAKNPQQQAQVSQNYAAALDDFRTATKEVFGIEQISW